MKRFIVILGLAGLSLAATARSQEEPLPHDEDAFFATVDVNVVNVEVFVTDKQGNPVTGLTADDFEVLEDKRPVTLTNFYEVESGKRRQPSPEPTTSSEDAPTVPGIVREVPDLPEDQRLFLIIYVDNFNIRPFNRNRVFRNVREFLHDHVDETDQVMLVSYDRSINVRHPFTSDASVISRALYDLEDMTGHAVSRDSDRKDVLAAIDEADDALEVEWRVRQYAEAMYNDLSFTVDALRDFVGTVAGLEGRKAILYVSDGLAMTSGEDMFQALQHKFVTSGVVSRMHDYSALRQFSSLTSLAATNRVSFYTIDAAGLRSNNLVTADSRGYETPGLTTLLDSTYINNMQAPLRFMAEQTGGMAMLNTNNFGPKLDRMARDFDTFYSLGYASGHRDDGRYHRIRVRVKNRKGLKVRHRDGYRAKSVYSQMADQTNSTLLYGFGRNPLDVGLRVGQGKPQDGGLYLVPIAVDVPIANIEMVPRGDFHVGRVKLYFSALDEDDRQSDVTEVPLPIQIPSDEMTVAVEHPYVYQVELQMRGGSQRMAVGVRDEIGAVESFVVKTVTIGKG